MVKHDFYTFHPWKYIDFFLTARHLTGGSFSKRHLLLICYTQEVYLWHGTNVRAALSIAQNDFRIDLAGSSTGTMHRDSGKAWKKTAGKIGKNRCYLFVAYVFECFLDRPQFFLVWEGDGFGDNIILLFVCYDSPCWE